MMYYLAKNTKCLFITLLVVNLPIGQSETIFLSSEKDDSEFYPSFTCNDNGNTLTFGKSTVALSFTFKEQISDFIGMESDIDSIKLGMTAFSNGSMPIKVQITSTKIPSLYQNCPKTSPWTLSERNVQWDIEEFNEDRKHYSPNIKSLFFDNYDSLMWREKNTFELIVDLKIIQENPGDRVIYSFEGAEDETESQPHLLIEYYTGGNTKLRLSNGKDDVEMNSHFECDSYSGDIDFDQHQSSAILKFRDLEALQGSVHDIESVKLKLVAKENGTGDAQVHLKNLKSHSHSLICSATKDLDISSVFTLWELPAMVKKNEYFSPDITQMLLEHFNSNTWNESKVYQILIDLDLLTPNTGKRVFYTFESGETANRMPQLIARFYNGSEKQYSIIKGEDDVEVTKICKEIKSDLELERSKSAVSFMFQNLGRLKEMKNFIDNVVLRLTSKEDRSGAMTVQITYRKSSFPRSGCPFSTEEDWSTQYVNWNVPRFSKDQSYDSPDIKDLLFANFDSEVMSDQQLFEVIINLSLLPKGSPKRRLYSFEGALDEANKTPQLIVNYKRDIQCTTTVELSGFAIIGHTVATLSATNDFQCCKKCVTLGNLCKSYGALNTGGDIYCEFYNITKADSHKENYYISETNLSHYILKK